MKVVTEISKQCNGVSFPEACLKDFDLSMELLSAQFDCGEILPTISGVAAFHGGVSGLFELQAMTMADYASGSTTWTTVHVSEFFAGVDGSLAFGPTDIASLVNGLYAVRIYNSSMGIASNVLTNINMPNCT